MQTNIRPPQGFLGTVETAIENLVLLTIQYLYLPEIECSRGESVIDYEYLYCTLNSFSP